MEKPHHIVTYFIQVAFATGIGGIDADFKAMLLAVFADVFVWLLLSIAAATPFQCYWMNLPH